jgi:hypothetical protein
MPVLDYVPRLDERNRAHRVGAAPVLASLPRYWQPSATVLDQGQEGACVGMGVTGEYGASPVRGKISNTLALDVYNRAKQVDEFEGVDYDGTSVRAGMLVGRERGWWTGFKWAFNMTEVRTALETGPVVIGIQWKSGMYEAPGGILLAKGKVVGGHCILITGYDPKHPAIGGPAYELRNSWSASWGVKGSAFISAYDLNAVLFKSGGEAAVPIGRKL